ncbi:MULTISPECIES: DUF4260 domain-containing protein [unclassified Methylobacterium]|jgi:Domain of unknown function (DUF4260)|uniref:DUF4260 domain-containing protein n=1 Tax=unclassified Methylobacterium TaxID=2615210 RepID=UPI001353090B|nr:DUF4260 domain-containing protein [Methylobacterium sp. 2A]MWV25616.1 DUF4260 family protein [Methylobacterium sp. 2A]
MSDGFVGGWPRSILRIEGACLLACALAAYAWLGRSWWIFAALLLAPDLSMLGYAAGPGPGALAYNAVHTVTPPLLGLCAAAVLGQPLVAGLALIWLAPIGLDRMPGYGLKYTSGFGDTHLGAIGRARAAANTPR